MKILTLYLVIMLIIFNVQCQISNMDKSNEEFSAINDFPESIPSTIEQVELAAKMKTISRAIAELSEDLNLQNLKGKKLTENETEIRIWAELGYEYLNCFILNKNNETWNAYYISSEIGYNLVENQQDEAKVKKQSLLSPISGWKKFNDYLFLQGLHVPLQYSLDKKQFPPNFDEGLIVLEIKEGADYDMVFYREFTKTKDGQAILNICKTVEHEFVVALGCGN